MKYLLIFFCLTACIPVKIAPNLEKGEVLTIKKFIPNLGNTNAYIFTDIKKENEFYWYINAKFHLDYDDFDGNIPVLIGKENYYLTFYEVSKETKTINLIPILIDAKRNENNRNPIMEDSYVSRTGTWYIAITLTTENTEDVLKQNHPDFKKVLNYLKGLKEEYLTTANYTEVYLKN